MPSLDALLRPVRVAATTLLVTFAAGCVSPLAVQHEFFAPLSGIADRIGTRTRHTVSHHRALQAAQHTCTPGAPVLLPPDEARLPHGPSPGLQTAREALADLCATPTRPPVAAYGAGSSAYRRWAEDQVRELPAPSETAGSAAGGS